MYLFIDSIALPANWVKMKDSDNHKVIDVVLDDHDYEIVLTKFKEGITETNDGILSNKYSTISDVQVKSVGGTITSSIQNYNSTFCD